MGPGAGTAPLSWLYRALFFFFFPSPSNKSTTNLCSTDGAGWYYGGNNVRGEKQRGTQVERDTATLEEDVCFGGWPDGWGRRQATKGEVKYSGERSEERQRGVEGGGRGIRTAWVKCRNTYIHRTRLFLGRNRVICYFPGTFQKQLKLWVWLQRIINNSSLNAACLNSKHLSLFMFLRWNPGAIDFLPWPQRHFEFFCSTWSVCFYWLPFCLLFSY